jgi:hypothetical protein
MGEAAVYFFSGFGNPQDPSWAIGARLINQYKSVRQYYLGDFYPLAPYNTNSTGFLAYQFDRPDLSSGIVQAFGRAAGGSDSQSLQLFALDPNGQYAITNFDTTGVINMSGSDLMSQGLRVSIPSEPGAAVYLYQKTQ